MNDDVIILISMLNFKTYAESQDVPLRMILSINDVIIDALRAELRALIASKISLKFLLGSFSPYTETWVKVVPLPLPLISLQCKLPSAHSSQVDRDALSH
jgi:hypothetical protein